MGRAGDDPLVDSFDPGLGTGYLRHAPRDHELEPELGAHPFDPGPGRYDDRRARKAAKRARRERQRTPVEPRAASAGPRAAGGSSVPGPQVPTSPGGSTPVPPSTRAVAPAVAAPEPAAAPPAEVVPLPRRRPSMAERLERERLEREQTERRRRARIEREREERERAGRERREARRRERAERLRREREALRRKRSPRPGRPAQPARPAARVEPRVRGPVRRRERLLWPTAKVGIAITLVLGASAALGSALGLPVPGPGSGAGTARLANSADLFGIDQGTPVGLSSGYVFPVLGPHDFGEKDARFGAQRYGHIHEGQDIFAKPGTPEVAVHDGVVVDWGTENGKWSGGRGNYLAIYSPEDDHSFVYMHMLKPSPVHLGDQVHAGEVIGQLGCTGSCDGPHLHFEVRIGRASLRSDTKPVDPLPYLQQWPESTPG